MFAILFIAGISGAPEIPVGVPQIRQSIEKSLVFLERDGLAWETKSCVSCHHGPWMMWSGYEAKKRGFTVNERSLEIVRSTSLKAYSKHPTMRPTSRDVLNDLAINLTYLMFGMGAAGEPDVETAKFFDKAAVHLLEQQKDDGSWKVIIKKFNGNPVPSSKKTPEELTTSFLMPPLIDHDDVTTLWALLALHYREPAGISKEALAKAKEKGLKYLKDHLPSDVLQSLVLRIILSQRLGKTIEVQALVKELLALQKVDGGWSQTQKLKSDALGTGQAVMALNAAGLTMKDPAIAKARNFLFENQKLDGSWFVGSRAYQAPEFSSYMGTAWATLALLRTLRESDSPTALPLQQPRARLELKSDK